jgi:hypothetical protein
MTVGCKAPAVSAMHYTMFGDGVVQVDNVCAECLASYSRRAVIHVLRTTAPVVHAEIVTAVSS